MLETLESRLAMAVAIEFNYSLDTSGWFTDTTPVDGTTLGRAKDTLQQAADDLVGRFTDTLTAISAASGW